MFLYLFLKNFKSIALSFKLLLENITVKMQWFNPLNWFSASPPDPTNEKKETDDEKEDDDDGMTDSESPTRVSLIKDNLDHFIRPWPNLSKSYLFIHMVPDNTGYCAEVLYPCFFSEVYEQLKREHPTWDLNTNFLNGVCEFSKESYSTDTEKHILIESGNQKHWPEVLSIIQKHLVTMETHHVLVIIMEAPVEELYWYLDTEIWVLKSESIKPLVSAIAQLRKSVENMTLIVSANGYMPPRSIAEKDDSPDMYVTYATNDYLPGENIWRTQFNRFVTFDDFVKLCVFAHDMDGVVWADAHKISVVQVDGALSIPDLVYEPQEEVKAMLDQTQSQCSVMETDTDSDSSSGSSTEIDLD